MERKKIFYPAFIVAALLVLAGVFTAHAGICTSTYCDSDIATTTTQSTSSYSFSCVTSTLSSVTVGWSTNDPRVKTATLTNDTVTPNHFYSALGVPSGTQVDGGLSSSNPYHYTFSFEDIRANVIETSTAVCRTGGYTYSFFCGPSTASSIALNYIITDPAVSYINISGNSVPGGTHNQYIPSPSPFPASYIVNNLFPGTKYLYTATLGYNGSPTGPPPSGSPPTPTPSVIQCETQAVTSDAPSMAQAFANSPSTVYLNWKDNATSTGGSYEFVVQRMLATPNGATTTSAAASEDSSNDISTKVNWGDFTTSSPYYALIERSADPFFATTTLLNYNVADLATTTSGYANQTYNDLSQRSFSYTDNSVGEATTYYYRIRECSQLNLGGYYPVVTGGVELNSGTDGEPPNACGGPSPAFGTTTPPYAPVNLTAAANGPNEIDLRWTNISRGASYLQIERDGQIIDSGLTPTSTTSYADDTVSSNTSYTYNVRACFRSYDYVVGKKVSVCSNWSNSSSAATDFVVNMSTSGTGSGTVTSDPQGINCGNGGSCTASFSYGTLVTLTASASGGSIFVGWSGNCSGGGTCAVSGDANATAIFNKQQSQPQNNLTVALNPQIGAAGVAKVSVVINSATTTVTTSTTLSVASGTPVTLTAWSDTSLYTFSGWTGNVCGSQTNTVCTFNLTTTSQATANFAILSGYNSRSFIASLASAVSSSVKSLALGASRIFGDIVSGFGKMIAFLSSTETAEGQTASDNSAYNPYFATTTVTGNPSFEDTGLLPDTIYVYRVKVLYNDGRTSGWSNWAAAKTLVAGSGSSIGQVPVCTANSVCSSITGVEIPSPDTSRNPQVEKSEQQCATNAECSNVGRVNAIFREK